MKLFIFYSCLLVVLFQAIFASTASDESASLKSEVASVKINRRLRSKVKPVAGKSGKKKKPLSTKKKAGVRKPSKQKGVGTSDKSKGVAVKEDTPKCLSEMLPKVLMKIVIDYFKEEDDTYSILVSTLNWSLATEPEIAVDSTRVYVATNPEGLKGLDHSSASLKESDRRYIEFGNPQWSNYDKFSSSHEGRYVSFGHFHIQGIGTKWFTQDNELEDGKPRSVIFGGESFSYGLLSRNGQTLCSCDRLTEVTRVYQIKEEPGKGPTAVMKLELSGLLLAVSGKGNRVMVERGRKLEIHDISKKGTSDLVCRIDVDVYYSGDYYALNEDGSEAVYRQDDAVRIAKLDNVVGGKVEPVTFTVKAPMSLGSIDKLVYSPENKLHVLHGGGKVSLYDRSAKELVPIESPQEGQRIISAAISPNADYFAVLRALREEGEKTIFEMVVKRKPTTDDVMGFLGYEADKSASSSKQAKSPSEGR